MVSLVIYVIVMIIVSLSMGLIVNKFYSNNSAFEASTSDVVEFNKFNTYFLKEIKLKDNTVDRIDDNYILFSSGNVFRLLDGIIFYNKTKVCKNVEEFEIEQDEENEKIVYITLKIGNFSKTITYLLEDIY